MKFHEGMILIFKSTLFIEVMGNKIRENSFQYKVTCIDK